MEERKDLPWFNRAEYELDPKLCEWCDKPLEWKQRKGRFCSSTCATTAAPKDKLGRMVKQVRPEMRCSLCGKALKATQRYNIYCSRKCGNDAARMLGVRRIQRHKPRAYEPKEPNSCALCGANTLNPLYCSLECTREHALLKRHADIESKNGRDYSSRALKLYLIRTRGHKCMECGRVKWLGEVISLVLDHIDGNPFNNDLSNLRILCPNCDALLPTYKGRNRGNGRYLRMKINAHST